MRCSGRILLQRIPQGSELFLVGLAMPYTGDYVCASARRKPFSMEKCQTPSIRRRLPVRIMVRHCCVCCGMYLRRLRGHVNVSSSPMPTINPRPDKKSPPTEVGILLR